MRLFPFFFFLSVTVGVQHDRLDIRDDFRHLQWEMPTRIMTFGPVTATDGHAHTVTVSIAQFVNGLTCVAPLTVQASSHFPISISPTSLDMPNVGSLTVVSGQFDRVADQIIIVQGDEHSTFY